jgi:hypothetical protein
VSLAGARGFFCRSGTTRFGSPPCGQTRVTGKRPMRCGTVRFAFERFSHRARTCPRRLAPLRSFPFP